MLNEQAPPLSRTFMVWWVCGLLLFASMINYMDRQCLATAAPRIKREFQISNQQYGNLELAFGMAFAVGSLAFGVVADRTNIRWLYPCVLLLWSLMGFLTGYVETFTGMLLCRMFLGLFEAGHWPCALKTTYRLLPAENRALGNSVLQSGTAIGAIVTPLIIGMTREEIPGSWRIAFQIIASVGIVWVIAWLFSTNPRDLAPLPNDSDTDKASLPQAERGEDAIVPERHSALSELNTGKPEAYPALPDKGDRPDTLLSAIFSRKFLVLVVIVVCINAIAQLFRAWMPLFLESGRGYSESSMLRFMFFYYVVNDVGCLSGGLLSRKLHQSGFSVHASRCTVFGLCAVLVATGGLIPWLPSGSGLIVVLMMVALGTLGLFPCYYSFGQELSKRHQGKVTGLLGTISWVTSAPLHPLLGHWADATKSYDLGMALVCGLPLIAFFVLLIFWPANRLEEPYNPHASFK